MTFSFVHRHQSRLKTSKTPTTEKQQIKEHFCLFFLRPENVNCTENDACLKVTLADCACPHEYKRKCNWGTLLLFPVVPATTTTTTKTLSTKCMSMFTNIQLKLNGNVIFFHIKSFYTPTSFVLFEWQWNVSENVSCFLLQWNTTNKSLMFAQIHLHYTLSIHNLKNQCTNIKADYQIVYSWRFVRCYNVKLQANGKFLWSSNSNTSRFCSCLLYFSFMCVFLTLKNFRWPHTNDLTTDFPSNNLQKNVQLSCEQLQLLMLVVLPFLEH